MVSQNSCRDNSHTKVHQGPLPPKNSNFYCNIVNNVCLLFLVIELWFVDIAKKFKAITHFQSIIYHQHLQYFF